MNKLQIIECVPNISEGCNDEIIDLVASEIRSVNNVKLLHIDSGCSANRTVFTFAGETNAVFEAAFKMYSKVYELIDMQNQKGEHPRIGAVDVCPFIPVREISFDELNEKVFEFCEKLTKSYPIPVYCYEKSARHSTRKNLSAIRKGEYENLPGKLQTIEWKPDFGPSEMNKTFGATVIGARDFLIAYNININVPDIETAKKIAGELRESGKVVEINGNKVKQPGRLSSVKAIAWYLKDSSTYQISTNITDYNINGFYEVYTLTEALVKALGGAVTGSELIGLVPFEAVKDCAQKIIHQSKLQAVKDEDVIQVVSDYLGLKFKDTDSLELRVLDFKLD